jgi:SagB-type dehydrogenase family enzyme
LTEDIGKEFMEKTRYKYLGDSDQAKGVTPPPLEQPYDESKAVVELPEPRKTECGAYDLRTAIEERRSLRSYSEEALNLEELSWLLWSTQGVKEVAGRQATLRTVPSAGARHAFETYLLVNRVAGLEPGLYRFLALDHKLVEVDLEPGISDKVTAASYRQAIVKKGAVTFIWVAVPHRMNWRYQVRGYRYMHLDAGHVCQNLYLASEAIGCGACAIGAFNDDELNALLGFDGVEQFVIYEAVVGRKP